MRCGARGLPGTHQARSPLRAHAVMLGKGSVVSPHPATPPLPITSIASGQYTPCASQRRAEARGSASVAASEWRSSGNKSVKVRVTDANRARLLPGDTIVFTCRAAQVSAAVLQINRYRDAQIAGLRQL